MELPRVTCAALSPDGQALLIGWSRGGFTLWDLSTGKSTQPEIAHRRYELVGGEEKPLEAEVSAVAFSPNGKLALSAGGDDPVRLWEVPSGKELRSFKGHKSATAVAFSRDGKLLLSGGSDGSIKLWNAATGKCLRTWTNPEGPVVSVAFSHDSKRALSLVGGQRACTVWDVQTGNAVRTFAGDPVDLIGVASSADGKQVLSVNEEGEVKFWNIANNTLARQVKIDRGIKHVAFLADGKRLLAGAHQGGISLWDLTTGKRGRTFRGEPDNMIEKLLGVTPDGKRVIFIAGWYMMVCDVATGEEVWTFGGPPSSGRRYVEDLAFSPDGTVALSAAERSLTLWDVANGKVIRTFDNGREPVDRAVFSPNGQLVLSSGSYKIKLWEVATGKLLHILEKKRSGLIAFSADGRWAYTVSSTEFPDFDINIWDVKTGKLIRTHTIQQPPVKSNWMTALSVDGKRLLFADEKTLKVWDPATGKLLKSFGGLTGASRAVSPDGKLCLRYRRPVDPNKPVEKQLVDLSTGKVLQTLSWSAQDPLRMTAFAFSSDSKLWLVATEDGPLSLWEVGSGKLIREFKSRGSLRLVKSLAFSADGKLALSGEDDELIRLWEVPTGKELRRFVNEQEQ
jgi:WD40 repeat protein